MNRIIIFIIEKLLWAIILLIIVFSCTGDVSPPYYQIAKLISKI
jgi:hypothetical protein